MLRTILKSPSPKHIVKFQKHFRTYEIQRAVSREKQFAHKGLGGIRILKSISGSPETKEQCFQTLRPHNFQPNSLADKEHEPRIKVLVDGQGLKFYLPHTLLIRKCLEVTLYQIDEQTKRKTQGTGPAANLTIGRPQRPRLEDPRAGRMGWGCCRRKCTGQD